MSAEAAALHRFLQAQRDSVVAIVDGLGDERAAEVVVPSGWSPAELVAHLRSAEVHWLEVAGDGPAGPTCSDAVAAYRRQWKASDAVIATTDLDAVTVGPVPETLVGDVARFRGVLLHLIEETARHAGHLDVARELIDGQVGLGPR